ncbi:kinase-like domain-containing protein [Ampelomyces quisqualis]|uniref:Kinase-like domain-containing protein n=1 Tax=Ampelomyces quisqualis TaxID=50730 RepID=A0A6A5QDT0_AMPQU|nr:kinase-like domain-containing protein [Ampelomyces quisqualis]
MLHSKFSPACFYPEYHYHKSFTTVQVSRHITKIGYYCSQFSTSSLNSSPESPIKYRWIDGVERLELYEPGGYHPVLIDELLHNRYRILDKLGYGGYSTIWLARDETLKCYVAVKIGISNPSDSHAPAVSHVNACTALPSILDAFDIHGPNGTHTCYTLTPAQGSLKEASFSRLFPTQVARALAAKLATAVAFVHSRGFVHGDLHLRNLLVRLPSSFEELSIKEFREKFGEPDMVPIARVDEKPLTPNVPAQAIVPLYLGKKAQEFTLDDAHGLILSDFGEAFSSATEQRLGRHCKIPLAKRAPEAFFEPDEPLSYPSDIWSLGAAIWEILGMKFIFSESESQDEIVAEQIDNGAIPRQPTDDREIWPCLENAFEEFVQKYRRRREAAGKFEEKETQAILDLMRSMLKFRPKERLSIDEVLNSEWMVKWALPQLEQGQHAVI